MTTLPRGEIVEGTVAEYRQFSELLRSVSAQDWNTSTRCDGWTVANIAGHVNGLLSDVVNLRFDDLGKPEITERQAASAVGRTPADVAAELDGSIAAVDTTMRTFDDDAWNSPLGSVPGTLGEGVLALWDDTFVHADDIRSAIGRDPVLGVGMRASVHMMALELGRQNWGPATLALDGIDKVDVGAGGKEITGDPYEFVMAATGRGNPEALGLDETVNVYR